MEGMKEGTSNTGGIIPLQKEWDEVSCPICMDHPHNAVLLFCSSHEKGCRSYICDTSYRHSNCLDQFKKSKVNHEDSSSLSSSLVQENSTVEPNDNRIHQTLTSLSFLTSPRMTRNSNENHENLNHAESSDRIMAQISQTIEENGSSQQDRIAATRVDGTINHDGHNVGNISMSGSLKCPLCRGIVLGWMIVNEARQYLNLKPRSCSRESCLFTGNYMELRRHARKVHPSSRPVDVDPSRQKAWRHLENQREHGDILSAIGSAMPGAIVLGDYVIDNGDALSRERDFGGVGGPLWSTLFLFHMISSSRYGTLDETRRSSRPYGHRNLWGVNLLGLQDDYDDDDVGDLNLEDDVMVPRRRRRFTRPRRNEEQP
ncbi:hypothetical protein M5K25_017086 [Dendrobium thyrsiflorum]|uniref:Uncharacterized protein n=1 Tax=Dendrobium thyrsiflorum TaxID=117978 RepID=A0ABD0ULX0_DENTH